MDDFQQQFNNLVDAVAKLQKKVPDHFHNGYDSSKIEFTSINHKKIWVPYLVQGTLAATAGNYSTFFIVPVPCTITGFIEAHAVKGTDGSAVTLQLERLTGTTAPGSGLTCLAAGLSLKATINTVQIATLSATSANITLSINDRLALKLTGTPTSVANVNGIVELTLV